MVLILLTMLLINLVSNIDADNVLERIDFILSGWHGVDWTLRLQRALREGR